MNLKAFLTVVVVLVTSIGSHAALVWTVGIDDAPGPDNGWPVGDGGGPNTTFLQENGVINALPGSPMSTEVAFGADNDYYFAGDYSTVIPSVEAFYGAYTPLGSVADNEEGAERAFAAADNDLRYHFNMPSTFGPNDLVSVTFDASNLDDPSATNTDVRYGVEVLINGIQVLPQVIIRPADLDFDYTSAQFKLSDVNIQTSAGADNIVSLIGTNFNNEGGGNWMGVDYVQLDAQVIPEPTSAAMLLFGAIGVLPMLRRKRA